MIKPPFTILILKKNRRPVTLRVSVLLFLAVCLGVPLFTGLAGFGFSRFTGGRGGGNAAGTIAAPEKPSGAAVPVEAGKEAAPSASVEIGGVFVSFTRGGGMDISFMLGGVPFGEKAYVWAVVNPDSPSKGGPFIHPRSPVFRGYPIDYRNGILVNPSRGKACSISISGGLDTISPESLRLIVYSTDGTLLAEKRFTITR